jgi:RHS repeat-associated protein
MFRQLYTCNSLNSNGNSYPFGMQMPGRHTIDDPQDPDGNRYGFNGMEMDDEIKGSQGTSYDFGARIYDPRVGRWLSGDPKKILYPELSVYAYSGNSPIVFVDKDGEVIIDPKTNKPVVKVNGEWKTITKTDNEGKILEYGSVSDKFVTNSQPVLDNLTASKAGTKVYDQMQGLPTKVIIDTEDEYNKTELKAKNSNSEWSTKNGSPDTKDGFYKSPVIITPDLKKIEGQAREDGIDFGEKLLQVMSVEVGHLMPEQIEIEVEAEYELLKDGPTATKTYGTLLTNAVKAGIEYRNEKQQTTDASSNLPIQKFNSATGATIPEVSIE